MKKITNCLLGLCLVVEVVLLPVRGFAQTAVVIEGGTLIDGNGGAPVPDAVVIIQGNKIVAVSRKGQATYPANAQVIKADGKFILPGLFDCQVSYSWPFGEVMLNNGVTSTIDIGNGGEVSVAHRNGVFLGRIRGPRTFTGIAHINSVPEPRLSTGFETALTASRVPKSVEEVREMVRLRIAAGADYINFQDGSLPLEYYRAAVEEANKLGKPVFARAFGPPLNPKEAALMGVRNIPHGAGIGAAVTKKVAAQYRVGEAGPAPNELDFYADMDDAKAKDLIQVLVERKTRLTPTFQVDFPGYPKDWPRFGAETRALFADPNLRTYYPAEAIDGVLAGFARSEQGGAGQERRMLGFQNALRFYKMFSDAGGLLVLGGNTNIGKPPGLNLHFELQSLAEAGIAPMKLIQGATKWAAEMIDKGGQLGTIEVGKFADVLIVNADPLQSVNNLEKIDTVVANGKIVDRTYHSWYSTPFLGIANSGSPPVDGLEWVAAMKSVFSRRGPEEGAAPRPAAGLPNPATSPQPAIETIDPVMVTEGGPPLTVTLKGINFVRKSAVYFNGRSVPYKAANATELQVTLDADLLRTPGRFDIVVKNPEPIGTDPLWGNGTSNKAHLIVNYKQ